MTARPTGLLVVEVSHTKITDGDGAADWTNDSTSMPTKNIILTS